MNRFIEQLQRHHVTLTRGAFQTLQINVGRKCNQTCMHCHVDAGPHRTEMMDAETAQRVGAWIDPADAWDTFNMGIGWVAIMDAKHAKKALKIGTGAVVLGEMDKSGKVTCEIAA